MVLDWGLALLFLVFFFEHDSCLEEVLVVFWVEEGMQVDCCFLYHHLCRFLGQTQQTKQPCVLLLNPLCLVLHLEGLTTPYQSVLNKLKVLLACDVIWDFYVLLYLRHHLRVLRGVRRQSAKCRKRTGAHIT